MKNFILLCCLSLCIVGPCLAGTLTLLSGEQLTFASEKEFVAILLEEFLPADFIGARGFFLISDASDEKVWLRQLLVRAEELEISEANPTAIYPSIDLLLQLTEYTTMAEFRGRDKVFAVEIALQDLDLIYVYRLPEPTQTRGGLPAPRPDIIIDATGEGGFEILED